MISWYCITGKAFVRDDGSMGTAAIFEILLTIAISIYWG